MATTNFPRRIAAVALATSLSLLLAACGGGGADDTGPTDLTMTVWTNDEDVIAEYEAIADAFRQQNPELGEFTVQSIPFENYVGRLTTQLQGGDAPDLGWIVESTIPALANSGAVAEVGGVLRGTEGYRFDDILPNTLTGVETDQGIFGYPFANTTQPIVFNADMFAAAGVDSPLELYESGQWTWENLARIAREVVASGQATYGFDIPQFAYSNYTQFTPFLNAFGAEAWPNGTECGYTSPQTVAAAEFARRMIFEDDSYPAPGEVASFPTGDTAMYLGPPSTLNQLKDAQFAFDVVPQPAGVNGPDPFFGQAALVVFSDGKRPELATEFLAFVTNEENSRRLTRFFIPPRRALLTPEIVAETNPLLTPEAAERSLIESLPTAEQLDFPVALPQLEAAVAPILDGLWQPSADVQATLTEACRAAQPILDSQ